MPALIAIANEQTEEMLARRYIADCLGAIVRSRGAKDFPLFSEMIKQKKKPEMTPKQIIDHVKKVFSS